MATYTLTVTAISTSPWFTFSPSNITLGANDVLAIYNHYTSVVNFAVGAFDSGEWNSTASATVTLGSTLNRTAQVSSGSDTLNFYHYSGGSRHDVYFTVNFGTPAPSGTWTWTPFNITSGNPISMSSLQSFFGGSNPISMSEYQKVNNESSNDPTGYVNRFYFSGLSSFQQYNDITPPSNTVRSTSGSTPVGGTLFLNGVNRGTWAESHTSPTDTLGLTIDATLYEIYTSNLQFGQVGGYYWWPINVATGSYQIGNTNIPYQGNNATSLGAFYGSGYASGYWTYTP